nr:hypothetical protein [Ochrobactrum sp. UNC390CL2Tsu3S39]
MKLTRDERLDLAIIYLGDEGDQHDVETVKRFQSLGLVEVIETSDGNYATLTTAGRLALKGGSE